MQREKQKQKTYAIRKQYLNEEMTIWHKYFIILSIQKIYYVFIIFNDKIFKFKISLNSVLSTICLTFGIIC